MTCDLARESLSAYIDGQLSPKERRDMEKHLASCEACAGELEALRIVQSALIEMPEVPAPDGLHEGGMARIRALKKPFYRRPAVMGALAAGVFGLAAVGALVGGLISASGNQPLSMSGMNDSSYILRATGEANYDKGGYGYAPAPAAAPMMPAATNAPSISFDGYAENAVSDMAMEPEKSSAMMPSGGNSLGNVESGGERAAKIIYTADVSLYTTSIEDDQRALNALVQSYGAYVENESLYGLPFTEPYGYGRSLPLTVRVPTERFDELLEGARGVGKLQSASRYGNDITSAYTDTETRLRVLRLQLSRLEELVAKSEVIDDVLAVQYQITELVYQIESLEGSLRKYDAQVDYATIYVRLEERQREDVVHPTPVTLGERIEYRLTSTITSLRDAAERFVVFFVGTLPVTLPAAAIILIALFVWLGRRKRKKT